MINHVNGKMEKHLNSQENFLKNNANNHEGLP